MSLKFSAIIYYIDESDDNFISFSCRGKLLKIAIAISKID